MTATSSLRLTTPGKCNLGETQAAGARAPAQLGRSYARGGGLRPPSPIRACDVPHGSAITPLIDAEPPQIAQIPSAELCTPCRPPHECAQQGDSKPMGDRSTSAPRLSQAPPKVAAEPHSGSKVCCTRRVPAPVAELLSNPPAPRANAGAADVWLEALSKLCKHREPHPSCSQARLPLPGWKHDRDPSRRCPAHHRAPGYPADRVKGNRGHGEFLPREAGPRAGSPRDPVFWHPWKRRGGTGSSAETGMAHWHRCRRVVASPGWPRATVLSGQAASGYLWHELCGRTQIPGVFPPCGRAGSEASALSCFRGKGRGGLATPKQKQDAVWLRGMAWGGPATEQPPLLDLSIPVL